MNTRLSRRVGRGIASVFISGLSFCFHNAVISGTLPTKLYLDTAKFQAKSTPVAGKERSRPSIIPGTFVILVLGD
ncbi:hypothetical protein FD723_35275 (plasmid) [Nostoc sp. C052]|uniref:hypothetical protein n=1 Tax=Nostoc sp. C052 TaxID=2576902 RepID=UPI0015C3D240|nr:hypothetical protein [Nostoc sp. C052]QLE45544.1 hypothetical protein FD723_35275 [Nostoc sp. C052]